MHENALTKKTAELFPKLRSFSKFYLVGGTALALQIGHRLSVDLDLFSAEELPHNLLSRLKRLFCDSKVVLTYGAPEQMNILIDNVMVTFFHYEYPVIDTLTKWRGIPISSVREIAAMKAFAIGKRLSYKDYVDWYFLLKEELVTLKEVIQYAKKKFGRDFNDRLFLGQLVYMEDIPLQKIYFLRDPVEKRSIEGFLKKAVRDFDL